LVTCVSAAPAQDAVEILRRAAETYRGLHSYEASGVLAAEVALSGTSYAVTWPVSLAQADSTILPPESPVPSLSPLIRFGHAEFRDSAGEVAQPDSSALSSPNGWPLFGQIDEHVRSIRSYPTESIVFGGAASPCWVLEVDYEPGFPSGALSGRPVRYWIDRSTYLVLRQSFSRRDGVEGDPIEWTFQATALRRNELPPQWALAALPQLAGQERPEWIGRLAPEFALADLDGREVSLSELRGQAVLLSFWASWCAPCKEEIPLFEKLRHEFEPRGLAVWGINNEPRQTAREFLNRYGRDFPTLLDEKRSVFGDYEAGKIPVSVVVDRTGRVVSYLVGLGGEAHFRAAIEKALAAGDERRPSGP
jgi:peroxiredoxin